MKRRLLGLFLFWSLLLLTVTLSIQALSPVIEPEVQTTAGLPYVPNELLVRFTTVESAKGISSHSVSSNAWAKLGVVDVNPLIAPSANISAFAVTGSDAPDPVYRFSLQADVDIMTVATALMEDPNIEYAEPNYIIQTAVTPDDTYYFQQWGLSQIGAEAAWDITQGSTAMTIAILDTGLDLNHPDLTGRLWLNPGETPNDGIDNDNNGYVDDVSGWNFVEDNDWLQDDSGHGTHVTGIAAANGNNGIGVAGVDWNARIMPLRILNAGGAGTHADAAAALYYAADKGSQIINMSFGAYADSQTLGDAIEYASQTALLVGAAGNNNQTDLFYPAAYPQVMAVAGTGLEDVKGAFSNYGEWVDISAPGQTIWSTVYDDSYVGWSGTSMSAPFVSGAASLVWSHYPTLSVGGLRRHLLNVAADVDTPNPAYTSLLGTGRLDLLSALTTQPQPQLVIQEYTVDGILNGNPEPGTTAAITVTLNNTWADAINVTGVFTTTSPYITLTNDNATFGDILGDTSQANSIPFTFNIDPTTPFNYPITFALNLLDTNGYSVTLPVTVTTASSIQNLGALTINTDTIWTSDRQYVIGGQVQVATGVTLTIQPDVLMQFQPTGSMVISGTLVADGTANAPIIFEGTGTGQWGGLTFTNASPDAILDATDTYLSGNILRYAQVFSATTGVTSQGVSPFIANTVFSGNGTGLAVSGGKSLIQSNTFTNNTIGLSTADGTLARIETNKFESNTTGLAGTDVTVNVHENHFVENGTGLSLATAGSTVINGNLIEKNNVGANLSPGWPTSDRTHPDVAYMATPDEYLVVWQDARNPDEAHIYGQRLSSDGTLVDGEIPIAVSGDNPYPQLACDPVGNACLTMYRPQEIQSGSYEIAGQMVMTDGSLGGLPFSIGTYTGTLNSFALVNNTTQGGYLAVWTDSADGDYDVYAQRITASGTLTGTKLAVIADAIDQMDVSVAYNANTNEYLIVWSEDQGLLSGWDLYGRRLQADGTFAGIPFLVTGASGDQRSPSLASESNLGWYTVIWNDNRLNLNAQDIYGRRLTNTGVLYGNDVALATGSDDWITLLDPVIQYNAVDDEFIIIWREMQAVFDIAGKRISASGALVSLTNTFWINLAGGTDRGAPEFIGQNGSGQFLAVWSNEREGTWDKFIYGQRFMSNGTLLDNPESVRDESNVEIGFPIILSTVFNHNTLANNNTGLSINTLEPDLVEVHANNLVQNNPYNITTINNNTLNLTNNYWGITNTTDISSSISGSAVISPILTKPDDIAPAILWRLFFSREGDSTQMRAEEGIDYGPVGSEVLNLTFDFSKPMDTTQMPAVTIGDGPAATYTPTHLVRFGQWISPTQWAGQFQVDWYTGDGSKRVSINEASGINDGFSIPTDRRFTFEVSILGASNTNAESGWGQVILSWPPADFETLAGYHIYRSTTSGGPYTRINNSLITTNTYTDTGVVNQTNYYYQVTVVSTDFQEGNYGDEVAVTPTDVTKPSTPIVIDDGTCTPYIDRLHAIWSASDLESSISEYQYAIGTTPTGTQVVSWTSTGTVSEVTHSGLNLQVGQTYYFSVKARNGAGLWSAVGNSNGISLNDNCPIASFIASTTSGQAPLSVQFTDQSTGNIDSWLWSFGDGITSTLPSPTHLYVEEGTYNVTLRVTGVEGSHSKTMTGYIIVKNQFYVFLPTITK